MPAGVLKPLVPVAYWKPFINARSVFERLTFGGDLLVGFVVGSSRIDRAGKYQSLPVRSPDRRSCAGRERCHPHGFAARSNIHHVDLTDLVTLALRRKCQPLTIGTPGSSRLAALAERQSTGAGACVRGDDPQIRNLVLLIIGRLY